MVTASQNIYTVEQQQYIDSVNKGSYDFQWMKDQRPTWGVRAKPKDPERGLTLQDINAAYAGKPEDAPKLHHGPPRRRSGARRPRYGLRLQ